MKHFAATCYLHMQHLATCYTSLNRTFQKFCLHEAIHLHHLEHCILPSARRQCKGALYVFAPEARGSILDETERTVTSILLCLQTAPAALACRRRHPPRTPSTSPGTTRSNHNTAVTRKKRWMLVTKIFMVYQTPVQSSRRQEARRRSRSACGRAAAARDASFPPAPIAGCRPETRSATNSHAKWMQASTPKLFISCSFFGRCSP